MAQDRLDDEGGLMAEALELQSPPIESVEMLNIGTVDDAYQGDAPIESYHQPMRQITSKSIVNRRPGAGMNDDDDESDLVTESSGSMERQKRNTFRSNAFKASAFDQNS